MAAVPFDLTLFRLRYPEFSNTGDALLGAYFVEAGVYLNNTGTSPVCDEALRSVLLNMLVAHLALLGTGSNGQPPSSMVGRLSQATEGSVSVSTDVGAVSGSEAWYASTKYGWAYWQATRAFRTARYLPGYSVAPRIPYGPGVRGPFGWPR